MVFFAYAAPSCGMFGMFTAYSFFYVRIIIHSSSSCQVFHKHIFSCFFDEIFWSLSFRTEMLLSFCAISHFLLLFFQQNSNFAVKTSYSAAFSRPCSPCIWGVQEMFSAVRSPLSARSRFRESSGSHAKCFCMNIHSSIHQYFAIFFLLSAISHQINRFYSTLLR